MDPEELTMYYGDFDKNRKNSFGLHGLYKNISAWEGLFTVTS